MSIEFSCETCGKQFKIDDYMAGKRAKCKGCGTIVRIPADDAGADVAVAPVIPPIKAAPAAAPVSPASTPLPSLAPTPQRAKLSLPPLPVGQACAACGAMLPPGAVFCTACGYDMRTGRQVGAAAEKPSPRGGLKTWHILAICGGAGLLLLIVFGVILAAALARQNVASPAAAITPLTTAIPQPIFPGRSIPRLAEGGIRVYSTGIFGSGPGLPMHVQLYLPPGEHPARSLPCVFIAPAGTRLIHGSVLGDSDSPEHLPYVRAGFAVLAYELTGDVPNDSGGHISYVQLVDPVKQFMSADGGIVNARLAVDFVLAEVPEVDPRRLYAAGHSSAATMALNAAAMDHRFRAVAAYAPACDVEARMAPDIPTLNHLIPGTLNLVARVSPMRHINDMACPVFLFHADDDSNVPASDNAAYVNAMLAAGKSVVFQRVPAGGHYRSMIDQGIPAGIRFFIAHGANPPKIGE